MGNTEHKMKRATDCLCAITHMNQYDKHKNILTEPLRRQREREREREKHETCLKTQCSKRSINISRVLRRCGMNDVSLFVFHDSVMCTVKYTYIMQ
jgi:hypothetical protein